MANVFDLLTDGQLATRIATARAQLRRLGQIGIPGTAVQVPVRVLDGLPLEQRVLCEAVVDGDPLTDPAAANDAHRADLRWLDDATEYLLTHPNASLWPLDELAA